MTDKIFTYSQGAYKIGVSKQKLITALSKIDPEGKETILIDGVRNISEETLKKAEFYLNEKQSKKRKAEQDNTRLISELKSQLKAKDSLIKELQERIKFIEKSNDQLSESNRKLTENLQGMIFQLAALTSRINQIETKPDGFWKRFISKFK